MASVRKLKKQINNVVYDVLDEGFSIQLNDESKTEATDKFIDEVVDFHFDVMAEIKKAKAKSEYRAIVEKFKAAEEDWFTKLNKL